MAKKTRKPKQEPVRFRAEGEPAHTFKLHGSASMVSRLVMVNDRLCIHFGVMEHTKGVRGTHPTKRHLTMDASRIDDMIAACTALKRQLEARPGATPTAHSPDVVVRSKDSKKPSSKNE